jgi:hypothetical protein
MRTEPVLRRKTEIKDGITEEEKWALVERIAISPALSGSQALQAFLRYITRHAIAGTAESIKEQRIGSEVLGRKPDYDTAQDNIVRVRAHELRQRLAKYFESAGEAESVWITIPRGSYVPVFHSRDRETTVEGLESPKPDGTVVRVPPHDGRLPAWWVGWLVALLLGGLLLAKVIGRPQGRSPAGTILAGAPPAVHDFWAQLLAANRQEVLVVAADSTFALWQDLTGKTLNLGQYLGRGSLLSESTDAKMRELAVRRLTSAADLDITVRLTELSGAVGGRVRAQYARNINMHELQAANTTILIGSRRSNPWVELFEPQMNFILTQDASTGAPVFVNQKPKAGEPGSFALLHPYDSYGTEAKEVKAYAHIAFVSNLSSTGKVLILEGLTMEGTEAAGEFIANKDKLADLLHRLDYRAGETVKPFEVLLNLTSMPGGFANTRVVAYRSIKQ